MQRLRLLWRMSGFDIDHCYVHRHIQDQRDFFQAERVVCACMFDDDYCQNQPRVTRHQFNSLSLGHLTFGMRH